MLRAPRYGTDMPSRGEVPPPLCFGTTIGTLASPWRARVTPWGALVPADGTPPLDWWIAADDRWHEPASEPSRRQHRILGAPVVETVVAVPGGDIAQRVYAVADAGATPIVELENRSSLPVAVAFSRADALTGRPLAPLAPDAPDGAAVAVPLAHRATVRVGLARAPSASTPSAEHVARGWVTQTETGTRFALPDEVLTRAVVAARAEVLLAGPLVDPIELVLTERERVRLGAAPEPLVAGVAEAAVAVAKAAKRAPAPSPPWDVASALTAASEVLARAGDTRAAADVEAMANRLGPAGPPPAEAPEGVRLLPWLEGRLAAATPAGGIDLLPGFPPSWAGQGVEVYGAVAAGVTVAFALRWHGERPALLWDLDAAVALHLPGARPGLVGGRRTGRGAAGAVPVEKLDGSARPSGDRAATAASP